MLAAIVLAAAVEIALVASNSLSGTWKIVQPDSVSLDGVRRQILRHPL